MRILSRPRPPRPPRLAAVLVLALSSALATGCASIRSGVQAAYNDDVVGRIADPLVGSRWVTHGQPVPPNTYTGHHTVLVFFDPGADATAAVVPELRALHTEYAPTGVAFLGVTDADAERLGFLTEDHPIPFPVLTESPQDRTNFRIKKLFEPEVLLVDPYGRIVEDGLDDVRGALRSRR